MVKIQPLSLVFSLRNSWLKYFVTYSFGNSRKKVSTIFYDTAFLINEDRGNGTGGMCVSGIMYGEGLCV